MAKVFNRRQIGVNIAGVISTLGISSCSTWGDSFAKEAPASPINPVLDYTFNSRPGMASGWVYGVSFSPSGRYLAIHHDGSNTQPSISVWDMERRKINFLLKAKGGQFYNDNPFSGDLVGSANIFWGNNDEWFSYHYPIGQGVKLISPINGEIVRTLPIHDSVKFVLNCDRTKLLYHKYDKEFDCLFYYDIQTGQEHLISVINCSSGYRIYAGLFFWAADDSVIIFTSGYVAPTEQCTDYDKKRSVEIEQQHLRVNADGYVNNLDGFFISRIDPFGRKPRKVKYFNEIRRWSELSANINYTTGIACIDSNYLLDTETLEWRELIPSDLYTHVPFPVDNAFSPDGKYIYVATRNVNLSVPSGKNPGDASIYEVATGKVVGKFPTAWDDTSVSISPDGSFMALGRDKKEIEIYRLK